MRIHAIRTGTVQIKQAQVRARHGVRALRLLDVLRDSEWTEPLPILCWAVEHPEGLLLVDTGETHRAVDARAYAPRWHAFAQTCVRFDLAPEDEVGSQLRRLGLDPDDVRWVVMTHMHTDHAGGMHHLPRAQWLMAAEEIKAIRSWKARIDGYMTPHFADWLDPRPIAFDAGPWEGFERSATLAEAGDVRIVPTPGHTPGHVSVVVDEGDQLVVLAGDATYADHLLLDDVMDGVGSSARAHADSRRRLRELARRRPAVVLPTHDPRSEERLAARTPLVEDRRP